jgi:hypothetical protein
LLYIAYIMSAVLRALLFTVAFVTNAFLLTCMYA